MIYNFNDFKLYEMNSFDLDDIVLIYWEIDGITEPVKVKIEKVLRGNLYMIKFLPPLEHLILTEPINGDKIINKSEEINEPRKPAWAQEQPMSTDYSPAANPNQMTNQTKISNDLTLPNS